MQPVDRPPPRAGLVEEEVVLDLGPCAAVLRRRDTSRCVVLLPGASYSTQAPLLWFAGEVARNLSWSVLEVRDEWDGREEPFAWARDRARRAIAARRAPLVVLIGKSLASAAGAVAAERGLPAVWLTPLLDEPAVVHALAAARSPTLLVGSPGDPCWCADRVPRNARIDVLELADLDHGFESRRGIDGSLAALGRVAATVEAFLQRVAKDSERPTAAERSQASC